MVCVTRSFQKGCFFETKPSYLCTPAEHGHMLRGQQCNIPLFEAIEDSWYCWHFIRIGDAWPRDTTGKTGQPKTREDVVFFSGLRYSVEYEDAATRACKTS
jgi:hypothetical protein